jgi:hypothetical protein
VTMTTQRLSDDRGSALKSLADYADYYDAR